ncbi:ATP-binding protein [Microvirga sp. BT688]|uniref:ATP-binding protein n=1 Tax=Microvirga sp. TaxID=1873136 RepID=UPI0016851239|nr:ATP-binding protein [Microvirga sp.]MBD2747302.1 ATP-binding protein [Microvirga sp.]
MKAPITLRPADRGAILRALAAGAVPRTGLQHIQVGRLAEITALRRDIEHVAGGGSSFRLVIGEYGAGKTFFLSLVRIVALEHRLVTAHADLGPYRRLHGTSGQARTLYAEAVRNLATRTAPDGGALGRIVERFVTDAMKEAPTAGLPVEDVIDSKLAPIQEQAGGYDYAAVLKAYWAGSQKGNEALKAAALRWLRGEYTTRSEAREALGVRSIIEDANILDAFKSLARFVRVAGYAGLFVILDELVNLYRIQNPLARGQNLEQILSMVNDVMQRDGAGIGFVLGGTPDFLQDPRRGVFSYPALRSRLEENSFARVGLVDLSGPVIRLPTLAPEELFVLLSQIRSVFSGYDPSKHLVPDQAIMAFMADCRDRIGDAYFRTPRSTVRRFVQLLSLLEQNPGTDWQTLLDTSQMPQGADDGAVSHGVIALHDDLTSIRI